MLAVDTGSTWTTISPEILARAGFDRPAASGAVEILTASGRIAAAQLEVGIAALGVPPSQMTILVHQLPVEIRVQGVLGLDFFRESKLQIDFVTGTIELLQ